MLDDWGMIEQLSFVYVNYHLGNLWNLGPGWLHLKLLSRRGRAYKLRDEDVLADCLAELLSIFTLFSRCAEDYVRIISRAASYFPQVWATRVKLVGIALLCPRSLQLLFCSCRQASGFCQSEDEMHRHPILDNYKLPPPHATILATFCAFISMRSLQTDRW